MSLYLRMKHLIVKCKNNSFFFPFTSALCKSSITQTLNLKNRKEIPLKFITVSEELGRVSFSGQIRAHKHNPLMHKYTSS